MKKIGFVINPVAGVGGQAALKGSDGEAVAAALAMGVEPQAQKRAAQALAELLPLREEIALYTYGGDMGERALVAAGFAPVVVGAPADGRTTGADTEEAARLLRAAGVALLLFAGGDGTARNIAAAIGQSVPVVGIPAGVKIHSGVYAINPRSAGLAVKAFVRGETDGLVESEVMDIDETLFREGRVSARLYGYMNVPSAGRCMQNTKSESSGGDAEALGGMAGYVVDEMAPDTLYLIGPGSTTRPIMEDMGLPNTLLGVDVVKDRQLVLSDATERQLWALLEQNPKAKIVVTVIGGQGNLFGRGNQQFSPRILRRVGRENIIVVSTRGKLSGLGGRPLLLDTGDAQLDAALSGYVDVIVDYEATVFYKVSDGIE